MMFGTTIQYIARFADAALLSDVRKAYAERTDRWDQRARGAALTYLMRWDAKNSRPLLDALLLGPDSSDGIIMVDVLEPEHDPADGLREAVREYLQTAPPKIAAWCAFALSKIGEPDDRELLRKTLEQLRRRDAADFSHSDGKFEVELVTAVAQGRSWESTKDEIIALEQTCVSRECRQMPKVQ
jgi:HEAT repeat protein